MKKVNIDTQEKREKIESIAERLRESIEVSSSLQKKLESGRELSEQEIDDYIKAINDEKQLAKELKDFIEYYGK